MGQALGWLAGALPAKGMGPLTKPDWLSAADGGWSGSAHGLEAHLYLLTKPGLDEQAGQWRALLEVHSPQSTIGSGHKGSNYSPVEAGTPARTT